LHALCYGDYTYFSRAGLVSKHQCFNIEEQGGVFLRGTFLLGTDGQYHWIRLPSFILKFGKTLTDPRTMFSKKWKADRSYQQALWSQLLGYGEMKSVSAYKRLKKIIKSKCPQAIKPADFNISDDWSIVSTGNHVISDEEFEKFLHSRYKISLYDFHSLLDVIESIQYLPCMYYHQVLDALLETDY
jgi:hypothetical protein